MTIRNILLVDDHGILLDGLQSVIHEKKHLRVKATATTAAAALQLLKQESFYLMITDYCMPGMDGLQLVKQAREIAPLMKIIVLSMIDDPEDIRTMLMSDVNGYVLKKHAREELFDAIDAVICGQTYWSPEVSNALVESHRNIQSNISLTTREVEVLQLLAKELTSREIASHLFISHRTVETHRKNLLRKTGSNSVVGLIRYGYSKKLL